MRFKTVLQLIFLFFLFNHSYGDLWKCPKECQCLKRTIRCLRRDLQYIPVSFREARTLDVRYNRIYDIPDNTFLGLNQMRIILLNDNDLTELRNGAFEGLSRLKYLYLFRNKINYIEEGAFRGLFQIEQLYIQINAIFYFKPRTFNNMPYLERLYLHNNRIERIPKGSFGGLPRLKRLRLDNNALICDCSMLWMVVAQKTFKKKVNLQATCHGPRELIGVSLAQMTENNFTCTEPVIYSDPKDVIVNFGTDAIFSCVASGEPQPKIYWLRDSNEIPLNSHRYEVMNNGTLMVHDAEDSDVGYFECMARNPMGVAKSRPARMIVNRETVKPKIVTRPQNIRSPIGSDIHFDCIATGHPKPFITWLYNDVKIVLTNRSVVHRNGTIRISKVTVNDEGFYTCRAENYNGIDTSFASLDILTPPKFTIVPNDKIVSPGNRVIFNCNAMGNPVPDMIWRKDSVILYTNQKFFVNDSSRSLTIVKPSIEDSGMYECIGENSEGEITTSAYLTVRTLPISAPRIIVKPINTDVYIESSVQLPCEAESEPPPEIEWRKDGSRIKTDSRISITFLGNLVIKNVSITDAGRYECSAYNVHGRKTVSAFLTVKNYNIAGNQFINIALTQATRDVDLAVEKSVKDIFENKKGTSTIGDLFTKTNYPNKSARGIARAAEIYERALTMLRGFVKSGLNITMTESFSYKEIFSASHLDIIARLSGCTGHRSVNNCSDICYHKKYRSIDGSCNNLRHTMWGSSLTPFRRVLLPIYENGFSQPVGWDKNKTYNGHKLPSARKISTEIIATTKTSFDSILTHLTMQFGQWVDHDLDHALPSITSQAWDGVDCKKTCEYAAPCFPIEVPENDTRIKNRRCIDFIRTSSVCGSGATSALFGKLQPREQINQLTSFMDASQVYGFEKSVAEDLRDLTNENGMLRVSVALPGQKPLLPFNGINGMDCRRDVEESHVNCFVAGDIRANEQIGLAAFHTIWMREHNRLAQELKALNPWWTGDKVYNEARKIVGAQIQVITYQHWLPLIIGSNGMKILGDYNGYDQNLNPSVSNVFATAALRFGHSMINPLLERLDEDFESIPEGPLLLRNAFFAPWRLVHEGGVDPLMRGMFMTPAKLKTPTQNLNTELTERLFESAHAVALDLAAINIQRGRDHALPPYNKWRKFCNMTEANSFHDLAQEITNIDVRNKLKKLYGSVHNIDVWVGGILEDVIPGGKVGPLFSCLLIEQFRRLRDGDRLWYENKSTFSVDQLAQIKQTSLARILCDNSDNIDTITENVFILPEAQQGLVSCEDIPKVDLQFWAECEDCAAEDDEKSANRFRRNAEINVKRLNTLETYQKDMEYAILELKEKIKSLEEKWGQ